MTSGSLWGTAVTLLLAGLAGSVGHCLGMCSPLVLLAGSRYPRQGPAALPYHLLYLGAKAGMYALLGLGVGWLGSLAFHAANQSRLAAAAGILGLAAGAVVISAGLAYLGFVHLKVFAGIGARLGKVWGQVMRRVNQVSGPRRALALGALNGALPCPLVYSVLLVAAASGSALAGGIGMLAFGLGTVPSLLVVGLGAGLLSASIRQALTRVTGWLILLVGVQTFLRGLTALGLISHLILGRLMIW